MSVVIVTGGARGIGLAYVKGLAERGHSIVVADLADGSEAVAAAKAAGAEAVAVGVDISDEAATARMAEETLERFGRIDGLVNNAGYFTQIHKKPFDQLTVEEWDRAFAVNVRGTWLCCKAVVPSMREQGEGRIINTSSMTVPTGIPGFLHYVSSKSAIVGLTRSLARELGDDGIAVNTVSPDYIPHDEDYAGRQPEMAEFIRNQRAFRRDQIPEDMVGVVAFLLSPDSSFITGQNFYVNGGRWFG
ncbi:MAG: SDR family NAD(P)-dependent oxidoreductase [Actinomycetota bacterium]